MSSHRSFISYIDRTREYYAALGYPNPYVWSHYEAVPFAPLNQPLAESRMGVVTTASPPRRSKDKAPKSVWSGETSAPPDALYTDDLAWDRDNTHTQDIESFLPIRHLARFVDEGRIGSISPRFHGVPTDYSQRRTIERDAPEILKRCREDAVDVALLVPL